MLASSKLKTKKTIPIRPNYGRDFLRKWQLIRLEEPFAEPSAGPTNVTALCYCFGTETWISSHFPFFLSALRETWRCCGMLKTVFVSNIVARDLAKLRDQYPEWIEIRVVDTLVPEPSPDDIHSMSLDMDAHLAERFDSDYVLVIQDDGFPLRKGLETFLGKYDFYGSPSRSFTTTQFIKGMVTGKWLMNGGFSLRTKKCAKMANLLYRKYYAEKPYSTSLCEDIFYTRTLPQSHKEYRRFISLAPFTCARQFSFEGCNKNNDIKKGGSCPFGFHSSRGFSYLYRNRIHPRELIIPDLEPPQEELATP